MEDQDGYQDAVGYGGEVDVRPGDNVVDGRYDISGRMVIALGGI